VTPPSQPGFLAPRVLVPFIIITLIWGSTWFVIRGQIAEVPPSWSVVYRFLLGGLAMLGVARFNRQRICFSASEHRFAAFIGVLQFALNFNLVYVAEQHVTSGLVAVIFALLVVPNAIMGRIFLGNRLTARFIWGALVAIAGVGMLFVQELRADPSGAAETMLGIGLTLCAVMTASTANVLQATQRARQLPIMSLIGWSMLWGTAMNAAWSWMTIGAPVVGHSMGWLLGLCYLAIAASAVSFTLYFGLIRLIGPGKAGFSNVVIPVIAMGLSTLFEGYRWTGLSMAAGILVLAGMVVALAPARAMPDSQAPAD
jgi:drug/metabolite transporter (DMT)-like permease